MARLLPFRQSDTSIEPRQPRLVELHDEEADSVFAALSTETARDILGRLYQEPGTATDVAEAADTSLQNARYHLEKLRDAGLVEDVDTWYSSRGTEMTVYAPTSEPLVVAAGPAEETSVLRSALGRLVGALGVLGIASLLVDRLARSGLGGLLPVAPTGGAAGDADGGAAAATEEAQLEAAAADAANATTTPSPSPTAMETETVARQAGGGANETVVKTVFEEATIAPSPTVEPTPTLTATPTQAAEIGVFGGSLPPGVLFFLGGLVVIAAVAGWWYWRQYRPLYGRPG